MRLGAIQFVWLARGLAILYALFLAVIALDVFRADNPIGAMLVEWLIHLAPSLLIFFVVWLTWNRPSRAAVTFLAAALLFTFFFHTYRSIAAFSLLTVPLVLVSWFSYMSTKRESPPSTPRESDSG